MPSRAVLVLALAATACAGGSPSAPPTAGTPTSARSDVTAPTPPASPPPPSPTPTAGLADAEVTVTEVAVLDQPLVLTARPGDDRRFVALRDGRVVVLGADGEVRGEPFLDIRELTRTDGERGLLGLVFHPTDARRMFVHYSGAEDGDTRLAEYAVSPDGDRVEPSSARLLLTIEQPAANHNGGTVTFGPDGMLWLALGDGGGGGDTFGNGQDPTTLLGTLLRIDVDRRAGGRPYAIPADNPFADGEGGAPEVWAYGLRNPYRIDVDRRGRLVVADVGQNAWEEIDVQGADRPGLNYGWPIMEGTHCFPPGSDCDGSGLVLPAHEYATGDGTCGVIGGHVYEGSAIPALRDVYLYGDLCAGWVRGLAIGPTGGGSDRELLSGLGTILSFGEDARGELYVLTADAVLAIVPA